MHSPFQMCDRRGLTKCPTLSCALATNLNLSATLNSAVFVSAARFRLCGGETPRADLSAMRVSQEQTIQPHCVKHQCENRRDDGERELHAPNIVIEPQCVHE
jgi:hypothetical protein